MCPHAGTLPSCTPRKRGPAAGTRLEGGQPCSLGPGPVAEWHCHSDPGWPGTQMEWPSRVARPAPQDGEYCRGEVFYFDYGCLALWGLSERQEREVIRALAGPCLVDALPAGEVELDEFQVGLPLCVCVCMGWGLGGGRGLLSACHWRVMGRQAGAGSAGAMPAWLGGPTRAGSTRQAAAQVLGLPGALVTVRCGSRATVPAVTLVPPCPAGPLFSSTTHSARSRTSRMTPSRVSHEGGVGTKARGGGCSWVRSSRASAARSSMCEDGSRPASHAPQPARFAKRDQSRQAGRQLSHARSGELGHACRPPPFPPFPPPPIPPRCSQLPAAQRTPDQAVHLARAGPVGQAVGVRGAGHGDCREHQRPAGDAGGDGRGKPRSRGTRLY